MPTRVKISFPQDEKTITVERDVAENGSIAQEIKGWDRGRIQKYLEMGLGTSIEEEIVGKIDIERVSDLINEIDES
ncbi:hypothetical protein C5S53_15960 [Methanophagales archaeon]|nr:hypothetical protein C5S53_15960 [Methanophagales archaeon]